jgi:RNA polymerase-binding transcription factor DksA
MHKPVENKMRKKILVKALNKNLDRMSKSPWVHSMKEAKDLICPFCDQPVQPCKSDPSAMCERMLREGTVGKEIEDALEDSAKNRYGVCLNCGKQISTAHLKKHPTAEVCIECIPKSRKTKAVKVV